MIMEPTNPDDDWTAHIVNLSNGISVNFTIEDEIMEEEIIIIKEGIN